MVRLPFAARALAAALPLLAGCGGGTVSEEPCADDGNSCTSEARREGACVSTAVPEGTPCTSGTCQAGACVPSSSNPCGDSACGAGEDCASCPSDCGSCPAVVAFESAAYRVDEGAGELAVGLLRTGDLSGATTVEWGTFGDTASGGQDYGAVAWTALTFAPGEARRSVRLIILDDSADEPDETVRLALRASAASGIVDEALVTIVDDDETPQPPASSLRVDPAFSAASLPADVQTWYARLWTAIRSPTQYLNATELANSNDTYSYGRNLNDYLTSLLQVMRLTRDPALLDEVDRLAQLMRAQLRDSSILSYGGGTYASDGYLNWQWWFDSDVKYQGTDVHEMDEILTHSLVASFAWAFEVNRDLDPRYTERADFWRNYLKNHFEAKWRARKGKATGPFMDKYLTHAYTQWIRYHDAMFLLTGEPWYRDEALRKAKVSRTQMVASGSAVVWDHFTTADPAGATSSSMCQTYYYAWMTAQAAIDLHLQGYTEFDDATLAKIAAAWRDYVMDKADNSDFGPDICGGVARAGLPPSGTPRTTRERFLISPIFGFGAWDSSGKVLNVAEQVYSAIESDEAPRRIFVPAGMVFSKLYP